MSSMKAQTSSRSGGSDSNKNTNSMSPGTRVRLTAHQSNNGKMNHHCDNNNFRSLPLRVVDNDDGDKERRKFRRLKGGWRLRMQRIWLHMKTRQTRHFFFFFGLLLLLLLLLLFSGNWKLADGGIVSSINVGGLDSFRNIERDNERQFRTTVGSTEDITPRAIISTDASSVRRIPLYYERYPSKREVWVSSDELVGQEALKNSKDYRRGMDEAFETKDCKAQFDWQLSSLPTCNSLHEFAMSEFYLEDHEDEETVRLIANGYWRDVWKVRDHSPSGANAVLKTIRYEHGMTSRNFDRHRRDALAAERLTSSPYVVDIYGFCGNSGLFEYSNQGDLDNVIWPNEGAPELSWVEILEIAIQVAKGVAAVHNFDREGRASVAHTDITPGQFIKIDGFYKLNDFNRCRFIRWNQTGDVACGFTVGSNPGKFRAPEEYAYEFESEKVDVYSMGNVFYSLVTSLWPFEGTKQKEAKFKIMEGERPPIDKEFTDNKEPALQAILVAIHMCWEHDQTKRPSARAVENYLETELKKIEKTERT